MNEHEIVPSETVGLPAGLDYLNLSDVVIEQRTEATKEGIEASAEALDAIYSRSFSGRHPELGKMVNCQICDSRHRENERKCEQKFVKKGQLVPPAGLTSLTMRQVVGAARFAKKRIRPHSNRYLKARINLALSKQRKNEAVKA